MLQVKDYCRRGNEALRETFELLDVLASQLELIEPSDVKTPEAKQQAAEGMARFGLMLPFRIVSSEEEGRFRCKKRRGEQIQKIREAQRVILEILEERAVDLGTLDPELAREALSYRLALQCSDSSLKLS